MPDNVVALDISNHQGDLTQDNFNKFKEVGVQTIICGTDGNLQQGVAYQRQIQMAQNAGLRTEAYIYLYHTVPDMLARARIKLDMIQSVGGVEQVWMDCEDTEPLHPTYIHNMIVGVRAEITGRGYQTGIYTGRWWWVPRTGNNSEFTDLPLWLASYDGIYELDISGNPMSGWTKLHRKQLSDKAVVGGYGPLDYNIEERIVVSPPVPAPPPPEIPVPTPTPPQVNPLIVTARERVEEAWRLLREVELGAPPS